MKCKLLKKDGLIKDVFTERGDIKVKNFEAMK